MILLFPFPQADSQKSELLQHIYNISCSLLVEKDEENHFVELGRKHRNYQKRKQNKNSNFVVTAFLELEIIVIFVGT